MTEPTAEKGPVSDDWKSFYSNPSSSQPAEPEAPRRRGWADFRGLTWWQLVLSFLPLLLIGLGGLIGGLIGAGAMVINLKIARSQMGSIAKAGSMILIAGLAYIVWSIVVTIIISALSAV